MATPSSSAVALLSIRPRYADAIMSGHKRVEFRKQPFARPVEHVVIYATAPVRRIVGTFRVAECDLAEPAELWRRYGDVGGIERADFERYYGQRSSGVAIAIEGSPTPLDLPLDALGHVRPPQSFVYLTGEMANRIGLGATDQPGGRSELEPFAPPTINRPGRIRRRVVSILRITFGRVYNASNHGVTEREFVQ